MSASTGRGINASWSGSSIEMTSTNLRLVEAPKLCNSSVKVSGSDSSGMKCFILLMVFNRKYDNVSCYSTGCETVLSSLTDLIR